LRTLACPEDMQSLGHLNTNAEAGGFHPGAELRRRGALST